MPKHHDLLPDVQRLLLHVPAVFRQSAVLILWDVKRRLRTLEDPSVLDALDATWNPPAGPWQTALQFAHSLAYATNRPVQACIARYVKESLWHTETLDEWLSSQGHDNYYSRSANLEWVDKMLDALAKAP